ncbi:39S ribosomal protein L9, mitochondrial-like [Argonauta hians]
MTTLIRRLPQCSPHILLPQTNRACVNPHLVQARTTVIVRRPHAVPLTKPKALPYLKDKHKIYELIDNENLKKVPDIQCILTEDVDGVGYKNELLYVKRRIFRSKLYPAGLAMYATPENISKYASQREDVVGSQWAKLTMKILAKMTLKIPMSGDNPWELSREHVAVAFRLSGVEVTEEAITLPDEPVTQPEDIEIKLKMNNQDEVTIKCEIVLTYKDPSLREGPLARGASLKKGKTLTRFRKI